MLLALKWFDYKSFFKFLSTELFINLHKFNISSNCSNVFLNHSNIIKRPTLNKLLFEEKEINDDYDDNFIPRNKGKNKIECT